MITTTQIKKSLINTLRQYPNHVHASKVLFETVDSFHQVSYGQAWFDTYRMVSKVIQDMIFDKEIDFEPRKGVMIMRIDDENDDVLPPFGQLDSIFDTEEEATPDSITDPAITPCPPTLPSIVDPQVKDKPPMPEGKKTLGEIPAAKHHANDYECECGVKINSTDKACFWCLRPVVKK